MAQIGSFALLLALVCSAYCVVAGVIAIVRESASAMPPWVKQHGAPASLPLRRCAFSFPPA
jgi:hypothetical protein